YNHQLVQINYTAYDVRRAQDVLNPNTTHHNIMLLNSMGEQCHPYLYACILGIYHANIIYVGPGMVDYSPRRLDFLWVRWYQHWEVADGSDIMGWKAHHLDQLSFPPMASEDAFGFVDPSDVLQSCHVIPQFAKGKRHSDGVALSKCARDGEDWKEYYVGW
ncbi:hypothetical protein L208DRAFT_1314114, partial [Tricholoma matsutake]